jgi:hypothetical protein
VKAGSAGEAGAADFAGGDDRFEPFDQIGAHVPLLSHHNVMKSGYSDVPIVRGR